MRLFKAKDKVVGSTPECDACSIPVRTQVVDLIHGVDIMHCPSCYRRFEVPHAAPQEAVA